MLKPSEYFERYGEHMGTKCGSVKAFEQTEREFFKMYGLRRFKNYHVFRRAHWLYRMGKHNRMVICHIVDDFDLNKK